jgi:sarcosine oxidase
MASRPARLCVVGGGVTGLATAWALLERGADVTCLEQSRPGAGQSGGLTRVFRHVHSSVQRVELAVQARERWAHWERHFGRRLLGAEGTLVTGPGVDDAVRMFEEAGVRHSIGSGSLGSVLPIAADEAMPYVLDQTAGAIRAARVLRLLHSALGERYAQATVFSISDDGASVETDGGSWRGDGVIVCAGAHTAGLAAEFGLSIPDRRELHPQGYFRIRPEYRKSRLACVLERSGAFGDTVYASPVGNTGLYSVGLSSKGNAVPVAPRTGIAKDRADLDDVRNRTIAYVERALPGLSPVPELFRSCIVTKIADDDDAFAVWKRERAIFFAGHNVFKFAPLLGELIAETALAGEIPAGLAHLEPTSR